MGRVPGRWRVVAVTQLASGMRRRTGTRNPGPVARRLEKRDERFQQRGRDSLWALERVAGAATGEAHLHEALEVVQRRLLRDLEVARLLEVGRGVGEGGRAGVPPDEEPPTISSPLAMSTNCLSDAAPQAAPARRAHRRAEVAGRDAAWARRSARRAVRSSSASCFTSNASASALRRTRCERG